MKYILISIFAVILCSCGKISDTITTGLDGYSIRCIDGTTYILMTSERGLAITPLVGTDGLPKSCSLESKK
jgi:hypothetical protein